MTTVLYTNILHHGHINWTNVLFWTTPIKGVLDIASFWILTLPSSLWTSTYWRFLQETLWIIGLTNRNSHSSREQLHRTLQIWTHSTWSIQFWIVTAIIFQKTHNQPVGDLLEMCLTSHSAILELGTWLFPSIPSHPCGSSWLLYLLLTWVIWLIEKKNVRVNTHFDHLGFLWCRPMLSLHPSSML